MAVDEINLVVVAMHEVDLVVVEVHEVDLVARSFHKDKIDLAVGSVVPTSSMATRTRSTSPTYLT